MASEPDDGPSPSSTGGCGRSSRGNLISSPSLEAALEPGQPSLARGDAIAGLADPVVRGVFAGRAARVLSCVAHQVLMVARIVQALDRAGMRLVAALGSFDVHGSSGPFSWASRAEEGLEARAKPAPSA